MASIDPTRTNSELDLLIDMYVSCDYDMRFNFHQFQLIFNGGDIHVILYPLGSTRR